MVLSPTRTKRIRKTAQMRLVEEKHKPCCKRPISDIILDILMRHKGVLEEVSRELSISPSTIGRWIRALSLEPEIDVIRVSNGLTALYVDGITSSHTMLWKKVSVLSMDTVLRITVVSILRSSDSYGSLG